MPVYWHRRVDRVLTVLRLAETGREAFRAHLWGMQEAGASTGLIVNGLSGPHAGYGHVYGHGGGAVSQYSRWSHWKRRWWKRS